MMCITTKSRNQGEGDDPKDLHPARRGRGIHDETFYDTMCICQIIVY